MTKTADNLVYEVAALLGKAVAGESLGQTGIDGVQDGQLRDLCGRGRRIPDRARLWPLMTAVSVSGSLSAPGRKPRSAGGRLINCFRKNRRNGWPQAIRLWRVRDSVIRNGCIGNEPRGSLLVGSTLYAWYG